MTGASLLALFTPPSNAQPRTHQGCSYTGKRDSLLFPPCISAVFGVTVSQGFWVLHYPLVFCLICPLLWLAISLVQLKITSKSLSTHLKSPPLHARLGFLLN